jgi:hypothetical protein
MLFVCWVLLYNHCHRVKTHLQLINITLHYYNRFAAFWDNTRLLGTSKKEKYFLKFNFPSSGALRRVDLLLINKVPHFLTFSNTSFPSYIDKNKFLFSTPSRLVLRPTQPRIQWEPGAFYPGPEQPDREADRSPPTNTRSRKPESIHPPPPICLYGLAFNSLSTGTNLPCNGKHAAV